MDPDEIWGTPVPWTDDEIADAQYILDALWTVADAAGVNADELTWKYDSQTGTIPYERWANRVARVTGTLKGHK